MMEAIIYSAVAVGTFALLYLAGGLILTAMRVLMHLGQALVGVFGSTFAAEPGPVSGAPACVDAGGMPDRTRTPDL
jgi:hypothetical protein